MDNANKEKAWCTSLVARCLFRHDRMEQNRRHLVLVIERPIATLPFGDVLAAHYTDVHTLGKHPVVFEYKLDWCLWHITREALVSDGKPTRLLELNKRRGAAAAVARGGRPGPASGGVAGGPGPPPSQMLPPPLPAASRGSGE